MLLRSGNNGHISTFYFLRGQKDGDLVGYIFLVLREPTHRNTFLLLIRLHVPQTKNDPNLPYMIVRAAFCKD